MSSTRVESVPPRVAVKVNGTELSTDAHDALTDLRVTDRFGVPAHARLVFEVNHSGGGLAPERISIPIGAEIELTVVDGRSSWVIFDGLVVGLGIELDTGTTQHLVVEGYDRLYKLGRQTVATTQRNVSYADMIRTLISDVGLRAGTIDGLPTTTFEDVYRYGTAYEVIDRIVRDAGCEWFVRGREFNVRPRSGAHAHHRLEVGNNLLSFRARFSASEHVDQVTVTGWDINRKETFVGSATISGATPRSSIGVTIDEATQSGVGGSTLLAVPHPVGSPDEADALAKGIAQRRASEMLRARGEAQPAAGIEPGAVLEIVGLGSTWSGNYYCTGVEHTYGRSPLHTYFEVGPSEPESLIDLAGGTVDNLSHILGSLTVGIVTNNQDDLNLNRVRVKLPYLSETMETGWARVLQPGSGANRGWNVLPEINDEVLVGFEHGNIDRPFVLGGLLNGRDVPKYANPDVVKGGKVATRAFTSRLGHELRFDDGSAVNEQFIQLRTANGEVDLMLAADRVELKAPSLPIKVFNDKGSIEITDNGDITIKGAKISIEAQQDVSIKGMNVNVKANASAKVETSATLDLKANGPATLESSAITTVKGPLVKIN